MRHELLSKEDLQQIHQTSMKLLANVGVEIPSEDALAVFRKQGIKTDGSRVFLSEQQVMNALESVPAQFTIHARNPDRNVTVGAGQPVFAPGYGAPFLVDADVGKRKPTLDDYHNLVKLAHALPNQDVSGHLIVAPGDVSAGRAHLHMLRAHMIHSDKPFMGSSAGRIGAQHTLEMADILFGSQASSQPVTISLVNSLSPLGYSTKTLEALVTFARARQPLIIAALVMAGATGPITLAGALALQTAELLAGIALAQLVSPGTPVIFGTTSTNVDMRTGALAIGSPELSQMTMAHSQLARFYKLPSRGGGALTDASYPDAQAGFESMLSLLTAVNAGTDFVLHSGGIIGSYLGFSYEKFVMDDEMCGIIRHMHQGIVVTPETLAYNLVAKIASSGNYLMESHTVKRCRKEFWQPSLCDRSGLEAWMQGGRQDAIVRARRRWHQLLANHDDPPLDSTTSRQLHAFVEAHDR
jgi:trimethylamine--corrinoid protein Co-methyltransferase